MTTLSRPVTLQGHHLPSAVIRHPQSVSALVTALPKRRQGGGELRFGSRGSSRHRFAPVAKKPASSPQRTPGVKEGFPFSGFFARPADPSDGTPHRRGTHAQAVLVLPDLT